MKMKKPLKNTIQGQKDCFKLREAKGAGGGRSFHKLRETEEKEDPGEGQD